MSEIDKNITEKIQNWKKSLLEMTKKNRLLWYKPYKVGSLKLDSNIFDNEIKDVMSLMNSIAFDNKSIEFIVEIDTFNEEDRLVEPIKAKIKNEKSEMIKERTKSLLNISKRIKTEKEEKGLNIGYIAVGFLKWFEQYNSVVEIKSPLIMIPIKIEQDGRHKPFKVSLNNDEEITLNPVIKKKLLTDFNIEINIDAHNSEEELSINDIFIDIKNQINKYTNWEIISESVIDTFNFQNLVIWNDFEKNFEMIKNNHFCRVLAGSELKEENFFFEDGIPELDNISQEKNINVYEVDSSQQEAIYRARSGESFVIQGPPGTGKSQTITNIIAESLFLGKKVLFVSEKQAALDVVYNKLEKKGLDDFCLILHNSKQRKSDVREQISKSLLLSDEKRSIAEAEMQKYRNFDEIRKKLNTYNKELHLKYDNGITAYYLIGQLSKLSEVSDLSFVLPSDFNWNADYYLEIEELYKNVEKYGNSFIDNTRHYDNNYWKYYTNNFTNTTKRQVQELIGDINNNTLDDLIKELKNSISQNKIAKNFLLFKEYFNILDKIPFEQANYEQLLNLFNTIVDNENQIRKAEHKIKEFTNCVKIKKSELFSVFSSEIMDLQSFKKYYKLLINDYNSFFSRFSKNYKNIVCELKQYAIKKLKYKDFVKYLDILICVNEEIENIKKTNELIGKIKKSNISKCKELELNLCIKNDEVKNLLYKLDFETLQEYQNYYTCKNILLNKYRLFDFVEKVENENFEAKSILNIFKKRFLSIFFEKTNFDINYSNYDYVNHDNDVDIFKNYDKQLLNISTARIKCKLIDNLPSQSKFNNDARGGEIRLLQKELNKKSRLMPTRKLIENLPVLLPQLKPCMMMSPLTVSSYFGSNSNWKFDIVIFDEASQVKPEYAITSIVRASQIIVAGDSKQMPPTNFFAANNDDDEYDEENIQIENLESILDEMSSVFPDVYLNWHYRSKDESLIAFSNANFYNNRLATFPSPNCNDNIGIKFIYCNDGIWEGKYGNKHEAEKVATLVFEHFKYHPEQSLGVVAFGKNQGIVIEEKINKLRDLYPNYEKYFNDTNVEPFFIKNLENVQGDERDVIIISCGYGKDIKGFFAMRFGPLGMDGGERRLNVAISRAKKSMIIVSSFKANEIRDVEATTQRKLIRDFIDYAEHGTSALLGEKKLEFGNISPEFDSDFEENVYSFLTNKGYKLCTQVGASGYKIDMAVKHPNISGRFVLAIECDGAYYHSSRTARDRDILRQNVLENLGWKFYRIWSTDWFHNNKNEKERLIETIEKAIKNYDDNDFQTLMIDTVKVDDVKLEKIVDTSDDELKNIYNFWNEKLKFQYGSSWNSLIVMGNYGAVKNILTEVITYKNGFCPEDVFYEINEKVFEKKRYTEPAKKIYESVLKNDFIQKNKLEIINNTIRLK